MFAPGVVHHDLLESFDSNRWLLLPSPEMVNKIWDHYQNFVDDSTNAKQHPHTETVRLFLIRWKSISRSFSFMKVPKLSNIGYCLCGTALIRLIGLMNQI